MSQPLRFGPFEAHLATGELRKNRRQVRIQEQPFQILAALLEHPGEVVTRDQLRDRLWPGDAFGDFDQGLNTAINKLREALGDSATDPKYIETLPKRGYRFLFPLDREPVPAAPRRVAPWIVAACAVCAAAGLVAGWMLRPAPLAHVPLRRFTVRLPVPVRPVIFRPSARISPNGRYIAIAAGIARQGLWIHDLERSEQRMLEGTEGADAPFWSPDSATVGFETGGNLMKSAISGGAPVVLTKMPGGVSYGGAWSPDGGSIVVAAGDPSRLYRVPAAGGSPENLLDQEAMERAAKSLSFPLDGYLFEPHFLAGNPSRLAFSSGYLSPNLVMHDLKTGAVNPVDRGGGSAYAAPGYLVYTRPGTHELLAIPISAGNSKAAGEAFRVAENGVQPSISDDGTLVYLDSPSEQLAWFDRKGNRLDRVGPTVKGVFYPAISPDGRRVAVETLENANLDIWVLDLDRQSRVRLSSHPATDITPSWSASGSEILFGSYRSGSVDIWRQSADGAAGEHLVYGTAENERLSDWSRDGKYIVYSLLSRDGGVDIGYLAREQDGQWQARKFLATKADERVAKLSPDARYAAYLSDESGRMELYVRDFPGGRRKWVVSSNGAGQPRWSRDGKEIFYSENGTLMAVAVSIEPDFSASLPVRLFEHPVLTRSEREPQYDVSADRQRILLPESVGGNQTEIHVLQNWLAAFPGRTR